jgi:hypothetical protein
MAKIRRSVDTRPTESKLGTGPGAGNAEVSSGTTSEASNHITNQP